MARKKNRHNKNNNHEFEYHTNDNVVIDLIRNDSAPSSQYTVPKRGKKFQAQTLSQGQFISAIKTNTVTFGIGPAGTGKTYCTAAMAAEALSDGNVNKIVFTRPAVETGTSMGFLPGKMEEKFDPYFGAFKSCLVSLLGKGFVECALKNRNIITEPLAYMRGKTFDNAFVVLDEAQNCTESELKMFLTRIGKYATIVINGDLEQTDIGSDSGLYGTIHRMRQINSIHIHHFDNSDIVRSGIVKDILFAYQEMPLNA